MPAGVPKGKPYAAGKNTGWLLSSGRAQQCRTSTGHQNSLLQSIDNESGQPADQRAVDTDELQVAADRQLDALRGGLGIPLGDGIASARRFRRGSGRPVRRDVDHPFVDLGHERFVLLHRAAEGHQCARDRIHAGALFTLGHT